MKIAYLIDYDINSNNGVIQKILQQSSQWVKKGHTVYFVSLKTMKIYDQNRNIIYEHNASTIKFGRVGTAINLLYSSFFAYKLLKKIDFDIIYMRYRLYMPFFNRVMKNNKVIMEINSDDVQEYKLHSKLTHLYNKYTRDFLLKHIDGFVSVSQELKEKFLYFTKPIEVIANGINAGEYKINTSINNDVPILVFISTPHQSWQGMDKILKMAEYFKEYQFYLIGSTGQDRKNIKYFGYLSKEESSEIIEKCDVGIGTLSLYKKGLTEASPLKTRQYLACGLPLIYAYNDTDLKDDLTFTIKLNNSEDNMDYKKIEEFVNRVFHNHNSKQLARDFAIDTLDYSKKEDRRLSFFERVLHG